MRISQKGMYVANRDVEVRTVLGHVIRFKKDQPKFIPVEVRPMLINYGILPVDPDAEEEEEAAPVAALDTTLSRDEQLDAAVQLVRKRNDPDDFTAGGIPSKKALEDITGFDVTVGERNAAWRRSLSA